ncbi:hypothetical protein TMS3_0106685 [Pseudomonas taeanensis MS-3]|uniref:Uncharacterized protein n=1 Tax=Pseudomonas taeanensis MS-3 TaxID=1395571 RepID=A0A0A1YRA6_9PSED|nr:hypothetical protein TMS3_0106685 [Pseudomonas taeanensis MS-3]
MIGHVITSRLVLRLAPAWLARSGPVYSWGVAALKERGAKMLHIGLMSKSCAHAWRCFGAVPLGSVTLGLRLTFAAYEKARRLAGFAFQVLDQTP